MAPHISVSSVSERDIDLLLLEKFVASVPFSRWFAIAAGVKQSEIEGCVSAKRSVHNSIGESDLEVEFSRTDGRRLLLMVENKIAAGFQPLQAERYSKRGTGYRDKQSDLEVMTIITAPERYFGRTDSTKGFDGRVTYEAILNWFREASDLGPRRTYKTAVLEAAIGKSSFGYQQIEDAVATKFWKDYWELHRIHAPELRMPEPGGKPSGSTFIVFRPSELPFGANIQHKLTGTKGAKCGYIDLQLDGFGANIHELDQGLMSLLGEGMSVKKTNKSAAIRLIVRTVDPNHDAAPQTEQIKEGFFAAKQLLKWFQSDMRIRTAINQIAQGRGGNTHPAR